MQFNLNEWIVRGSDRDVILMGLHKDNLYETDYTKMHGADVVNLIQSLKKDGALELGHHRLGYLNAKSVHASQSLVGCIDHI